MNLLKTGESIPGGNPYVKYYGMEVIDKVKDVMMVLASDGADQVRETHSSQSGGNLTSWQ